MRVCVSFPFHHLAKWDCLIECCYKERQMPNHHKLVHIHISRILPISSMRPVADRFILHKRHIHILSSLTQPHRYMLFISFTIYPYQQLQDFLVTSIQVKRKIQSSKYDPYTMKEKGLHSEPPENERMTLYTGWPKKTIPKLTKMIDTNDIFG